MRETRSYGSVRGVRSNPYPYRDIPHPGAEGTALLLVGQKPTTRPLGRVRFDCCGEAEERHSSPYSSVSASQAMRISGSSHARRNNAWTDFHSFSERPNVMPFWWARNQ
jgi:hypothetical protein